MCSFGGNRNCPGKKLSVTLRPPQIESLWVPPLYEIANTPRTLTIWCEINPRNTGPSKGSRRSQTVHLPPLAFESASTCLTFTTTAFLLQHTKKTMVHGFWCCACATHAQGPQRQLRWNHISHEICRACCHPPCAFCFFDNVASKVQDPVERVGADLWLRDWIKGMDLRGDVAMDGLEVDSRLVQDGKGS